MLICTVVCIVLHRTVLCCIVLCSVLCIVPWHMTVYDTIALHCCALHHMQALETDQTACMTAYDSPRPKVLKKNPLVFHNISRVFTQDAQEVASFAACEFLERQELVPDQVPRRFQKCLACRGGIIWPLTATNGTSTFSTPPNHERSWYFPQGVYVE